MYKGKARAHTNIALIKYWGKADEKIILPKNNSLSLTLDAFYTETCVYFDESFTADCFTLDGVLQDAKATQKVSKFLDLFRQKANCDYFAKVESINHVPTAAGLASSASGLCALAGACNQALGLGLSQIELSKKVLVQLVAVFTVALWNGKKAMTMIVPMPFLLTQRDLKMN